MIAMISPRMTSCGSSRRTLRIADRVKQQNMEEGLEYQRQQVDRQLQQQKIRKQKNSFRRQCFLCCLHLGILRRSSCEYELLRVDLSFKDASEKSRKLVVNVSREADKIKTLQTQDIQCNAESLK
jgi:hypothetical protein